MFAPTTPCQNLRIRVRLHAATSAIMMHAGAPEPDMLHAINLIRRGIDGKSAQYSLKEVTGLHFGVHQRFLVQPSVSEAVFDAILTIERNELAEFAFYCHGGTHRSVGCACLLLIMIYPDDKLVFTTERTQRDALNFGCCPE